jgi:PBSX family phage terminase large subunit
MKLTPEDISALQRFVPDCKKSGMKLDQIDRFVNAGYFPHSRQQLFHAACRDADTGFVKEILVGGGRGGGKSHACVAQAGIDDCQRYSNLKVLFLRKVQKAAKESFNDLTRRVLKDIPKEVRQLEVRFPNGSFIIFGGFRNSGDIEKYVGIEYDLIIIEELTLLTLDVYQKLLGSLRTSRQDGYVPRLYASTNPGSIGHSWVKQRFVVPHRLGIEGKYDNGELVKTRFISSLAQDNPFLDQGYKKDILEKLTGNLRKMWLEGSWELNEAQLLTSIISAIPSKITNLIVPGLRFEE